MTTTTTAAKFTTVRVLFIKDGENLPTPASPLRVYTDADAALLSVKESYCVSYDNDMLIQANKYEVHDVTVPSFLSIESYLADPVGWKYTWGCGVDPTWDESWQRGLKGLSSVERVAAVKLLKTKNFRSDFRKALRDQLVAWLETPAADRKYATPFSAKQWDCLCDKYTAKDARLIEGNLYRDRHYLGCPVPAASAA